MKHWFIFPLLALSLTHVAAADQVALTVHTDQTIKSVSTGIYGQFLEHIFNSVHGGLWGDQILNGTMELSPPRRRRGPPSGDNAPVDAPAIRAPQYWEFVGNTNKVTLDRDNSFNAEYSMRITPKADSASATGAGIRQQNIALKQGETYTLSLYARGRGNVLVTFQDGETWRNRKKLPRTARQHPSGRRRRNHRESHRHVHHAPALRWSRSRHTMNSFGPEPKRAPEPLAVGPTQP